MYNERSTELLYTCKSFGDSTSSPSSARSSFDEPDEDDLPYPAPLPRTDFLAPTFDPLTYLSTLRNRHQTLEDLRSELRARSQLLNQELLHLVNANYQEFLGLASSLRGGDEKVEEVRVGLLGFKREIESLRGTVAERETEVGRLLRDRDYLMTRIDIGRRLLDIDSKITELEGRLMVDSVTGHTSATAGHSGDEDTDGTEDDQELHVGNAGVSLGKLHRHLQQYLVIKQMSNHIGGHQPFSQSLLPRMMRLRNTLLLDLNTALKQVQSEGAVKSGRLMRIMDMYRQMDEPKEAIHTLKEIRRR